MPGALSTWSTLHTSKTPRHPIPKPKPPYIMTTSSPQSPFDPLHTSSSRTTSLAGKKRPRDSDEGGKGGLTRRTKSTSDAWEGRSVKEREAFQRGLIAVFVPNALRESVRGTMTHYDELLAHFLPNPTVPVPPLPPLLHLVRTLTSHVSMLSPEIHSTLVSAIINLPWATGDEKFVKTYVGWAGVLVSAHPGWAKELATMAIRGLTWQPACLEPSSSTVPLTRRIFHARHHLLLSHLLRLVPTLPNVLQPLLVRYFPNKREPEVMQTTWLRNSCEFIGYCPELRQRVWSEVIDKILRMDVEISNTSGAEGAESEDEGEDAGLSQQSAESLDPFDLLINQELPDPTLKTLDADTDTDSDPDPDELSSVDGETSEDDLASDDKAMQAGTRQKRREVVRSMRQKLDGMLYYFFEHLEECMGGKAADFPAAEMAAQSLASSSKSTSPEALTPMLPSLRPRRTPPTPVQSISHFQTLLNLFSLQILPTLATQHIPFLLFLCSSVSAAHTDLYLGLLVSQALYGTASTSENAITHRISLNQRIAATVYIGSIVCRARFVTDEQARQVITYLLAYIDGKLRQVMSRCADELPLFYAVCQAVMLIFCFRWRGFTCEKEGDSVVDDMEMDEESVEEPSESKWMQDLEILQRALTSELNPLLGCNPTIVSTFARVAHHTNFAYCFSIIGANQQLSHSEARSASSHSLSGPYSRQISQSSSPSSTMPRQARQSNIDAGLDSYFPFDPYDLPRSEKWIGRIYRTWNEVAIEGETESDGLDEESEEESEDDDSSADDQPSVGISLPKRRVGSYSDARRRFLGKDGGLSSSLEGMNISPSLSGLVG